MFYEVNEVHAKIDDLHKREVMYDNDMSLALTYDDGEMYAAAAEAFEEIEGQIADLENQISAIRAEYDDAESLYWETAEARGWV